MMVANSRSLIKARWQATRAAAKARTMTISIMGGMGFIPSCGILSLTGSLRQRILRMACRVAKRRETHCGGLMKTNHVFVRDLQN